MPEEEKEEREIFQIAVPRKLAVFVLLAAMGGGGMSDWLTSKLVPPRPDPFTGTMGEQMEERLSERFERAIDRLRGELDQVRQYMYNHKHGG